MRRPKIVFAPMLRQCAQTSPCRSMRNLLSWRMQETPCGIICSLMFKNHLKTMTPMSTKYFLRISMHLARKANKKLLNLLAWSRCNRSTKWENKFGLTPWDKVRHPHTTSDDLSPLLEDPSQLQPIRIIILTLRIDSLKFNRAKVVARQASAYKKNRVC